MSGPDPAVAQVRSAVRCGLTDLAPGARVLVACSGGADSLALAAATAFVAARSGIVAGAVVIDHGWHVESGQVAARAAGTCRDLGLGPAEVVAVTPHGHGGPEAAAREARYAALQTAADRHHADAVLLGHTLDDQAETVLLGLARGSGARSLSGMAARRGPFRRPLLQVSRATTRRACAALGLQPWEDPANHDSGYARVRVRRAAQTLTDALGPGLVPALARSADLLREDADALDALADRLLAEATLPMDARPIDARPARVRSRVLDVPSLVRAPAAIRRRTLLAALRQAGAPAGALGRRHVLAVDALLVAWRGQGPVHLPGRVIAHRDCGRLLLAGSAGTGSPVGDRREPVENPGGPPPLEERE